MNTTLRYLFTCLLIACLSAVAWAGTGEDTEKHWGPYTLEELTEMPADQLDAMIRSGVVDVCIAEGYPATYCYYDLAVTSTAGGVWTLDGIADWRGMFGITWTWPTTASYVLATKTITLTATNPFPDGCVTYSGTFTQTGVFTPPFFSGTGSNDCGVNYSWSGGGKGGTCPTGPLMRTELRPTTGGALSTKQADASIDIRTFPNPASDYIMIDLSSVSGQQITADVYDVSGKLVASLLNGEASDAVVSWNVEDQAEGLYLVRITGTDFARTFTVQISH